MSYKMIQEALTMGNHENDYFVTPNGDGTWSVKRANAGRITGTASSRESAINMARGYIAAAGGDGSIYVQNPDGHGYDCVK